MLLKNKGIAGGIICNAIYNNRKVRSDVIKTYKLDGPIQQKIPAVKLTPAQIKKNEEVIIMKTEKEILIDRFYKVNEAYVKLNFIQEFMNEKTKYWSHIDKEQFFKQSLAIETARRYDNDLVKNLMMHFIIIKRRGMVFNHTYSSQGKKVTFSEFLLMYDIIQIIGITKFEGELNVFSKNKEKLLIESYYEDGKLSIGITKENEKRVIFKDIEDIIDLYKIPENVEDLNFSKGISIVKHPMTDINIYKSQQYNRIENGKTLILVDRYLNMEII